MKLCSSDARSRTDHEGHSTREKVSLESIQSSNHSVAVEVGDDEFGIGDRVGGEGGCVLTGH
jgi:hypothetical protein